MIYQKCECVSVGAMPPVLHKLLFLIQSQYDGAFEIQECVGATALMQGGVGMCTTGDIYVAVYGDNEPFTLEVYYDYCHSDVEDCYCDYVGIYFLLILVFLFS